MLLRQCKHCGKNVSVENSHATKVVCNECCESRDVYFGTRIKRNFDTDTHIYCRICGIVRKKIVLHIKSHNITQQEYQQQYNNAPLYSKKAIEKRLSRTKESREKTSKAIRNSWLDPESRERRKQAFKPPWLGKHLSLEHRLKIGRGSDYHNSVKGKRKDINYSVRSMYEANMCRILDYCGVKYEYENRYFDVGNGTILIIDFYLHKDFEMIKSGHLELKGWKKADGYFSNKEKFDLLKEKYPHEYEKLTFLFSNSSEWKLLENKYRSKIPMWETVKINLKTNPEIYGVDEINEKETWKDFIVCPLCFKEGKGIINSRAKYISYRHLKAHNYTIEKFRQEYPDFKMKAPELCSQHSQILSGENHFNFGKHLSEITREKISNSVNETNNRKLCEKQNNCIQNHNF